MEQIRIAVFASGKGSNLRAIYEAIEAKALMHVGIALVISNNSASGALEFAREHDITALHLSALKAGSEGKLETVMLEELQKAKIDMIVLAGYLKKLPDKVIESYPHRILNVHPALLPKYGGQGMYGLNVHKAVLACRDKKTGATVHYVDKQYDTGDIILQESCDVQAGDTPESLAHRVREIEHRILPQAIAMVAAKLRA